MLKSWVLKYIQSSLLYLHDVTKSLSAHFSYSIFNNVSWICSENVI